MNTDFENVVIQNRIDQLRSQLLFALEVLDIPTSVSEVNLIEYVDKLMKLDKRQFDLLIAKFKTIDSLRDMVNHANNAN